MTEERKAVLKQYKHEWYLANKALTIQRAKEWSMRNPDYRPEPTAERKTKWKTARAKCKKKNKERYRIQNLIRLAKRNRIRRATEPQFKIAELCRSRLNKSLRNFKTRN